MGYEYLEDVATADVAFQATGKTLEELFVSAGDATLNLMVENPESINSEIEKEISFKNDSLDMLLFEFLQEFIYYKDAEELLLKVSELKIKQEDGIYKLEGVLCGDKISKDYHELNADIKAVTLHLFGIKQTPDGFTATVVMDI